MDEKRKERRSRTFLASKILLSGRDTVLDCLIRDLSTAGARLKVDEVALVPAKFDIEIATSGGTRRHRCRVVWRRPTEIGVVFE